MVLLVSEICQPFETAEDDEGRSDSAVTPQCWFENCNIDELCSDSSDYFSGILQASHVKGEGQSFTTRLSLQIQDVAT